MKKNIKNKISLSLSFSIFLSLSLFFVVYFFSASPVFAIGNANGDTSGSAIRCVGDTYSCGYLGNGPDSSFSQCTISGRANQGGQVCDLDNSDTGIYNSTSDITFSKQYGYIPTLDTRDRYSNSGFFANSPVTLNFSPVDDNGSASVGSANYSYNSCPCGYNDVSDPTTSNKNLNCGGAPRSAGTVYGSANPGDPVHLKVINACKPNDDIHSANKNGAWGGGSANANIQGTYCYNQAYYTWQVDHGGFPESYRGKGYHPTAQGVCSPDNAPPPAACVINTFTATPTSIVSGGNPQSTSNLAWSVNQNDPTNIISIHNENTNTDIASNLSSSANTNVTPTQTTTYTLHCGAATQTATVTVTQPQANPIPTIGLDVPATVYFTPGQASLGPVSFYVWNDGPVGSTLKVTGCSKSSSPEISKDNVNVLCSDIIGVPLTAH